MSHEHNGYYSDLTIAQLVDNAYSGRYVLPGIQRRFVWKSEQIERLFDSIMQDYPINTIMLWHLTDPEIRKQYPFYRFLYDYTEKYGEENPPTDVKGLDAYAVIDGQQRITSLTIGLHGTFAAHRKWRGWENTDINFPKQRLYLDLIGDPDEDSDYRYPFRFMVKDTAVQDVESGHWWYPVGEILDANESAYPIKYAMKHGLPDQAIDRLALLRERILKEQRVSYYLQIEQDQDKVLEIFTRTNSGGVPLTKSDLIMAIASSNWTDMRDNVTSLVNRVNDIGFDVDKDLVLRSFLVCYGDNVKFKVENFGRPQVELLKTNWTVLSEAFANTFQLLKNQGFDDVMLRAKNAVIPLIQYLILTDQYKDAGKSTFGQDQPQRQVVDDMLRWLEISLLNSVFSGQSDTLLRQLRDVINQHETRDHFPLEEIKERFKGTSRDYKMDDNTINRLLETQYGTVEASIILRLLRGRLDPASRYEQDHLHPASFFRENEKLPKTKRREELEQRLMPVFPHREDREYAMDPKNWNSVLNLQLLEKLENIDKTKIPLREWAERFGKQPTDFMVPADTSLDIKDFRTFIERRRVRLSERLKTILVD
ncbi:DUF262 domain-containing protein [Bifidobacterium sp. SO1]|uniref:DUF262 domain-containing protein n=1 Tax=Bifidobacterium sp. SO1 TaxID=2809029 RepID=UPI001BDBC28D|nr:DUF262 domain-containing protein [Bifidobacterium sp. SO1]MBT1162878.1 DUF262 domain-containing protein [Bifidobacterium sp. SO1]